MLERLLHRLGSTDYRHRFVLKGAMLFATWVDNQFRPTRDLDLLGSGDPDPDALLAIFKEIAAVDGVIFEPTHTLQCGVADSAGRVSRSRFGRRRLILDTVVNTAKNKRK